MLLSKPHLFSFNHPSSPSKSRTQNPRVVSQFIPKLPTHRTPVGFIPKTLNPRTFLSICPSINFSRIRDPSSVCRDSTEPRDSGAAVGEEVRKSRDGGGSGNYWTTSVLLFGLWAGLMFYVFRLAPDQTPYRDVYFIQKLLFLKGDDGYHMNEVLVALWNIMGLWPLIYSMLLIPTGRSSRSTFPVWPFLVLSFFGGAYALIPYFVLWKPPPPAIGEDEISKWPLNFLESRITAWVKLEILKYVLKAKNMVQIYLEQCLNHNFSSLNEKESRILVLVNSAPRLLDKSNSVAIQLVIAAGLGLMTFAGLAGGETWKEFYQYFRESKFIHVMSLDFLLLSSFAPFWIYNDMTARRWVDKGFWLLPLSVVPLLGPALYAVLRPRLADLPTRISPSLTEKD